MTEPPWLPVAPKTVMSLDMMNIFAGVAGDESEDCERGCE